MALQTKKQTHSFECSLSRNLQYTPLLLTDGGGKHNTSIFINKKGNKKTIQTIHKPYNKPYICLISRALRSVQFAPQTIHKLYTELYTEPYRIHRKEPAQKPYTEPCTATRWQARLSSLEGCTVSNRGQRPRTAASPSVSAWKAVRPRRWRREPRLLPHLFTSLLKLRSGSTPRKNQERT